MAYFTKYTCNFTNQLDEEVEVLIQQKDGSGYAVNYPCERLEITTNGEEQSPFDCILAKQLTLVMHIPESDTDMDWDTLLASNYDDWKIIVTINNTRKEFEGFLVPEEGSVPFRDKPYSITLKATTGIALLKGVSLTDVNGDNFNGEHTLIEYIAGALKKTGLNLPIRCYSSYFLNANNNKTAGLEYDMFGQIYLDYRTFLKNPLDFISCYEALQLILNKYCTLEQWNGYWQICNIADKQYLTGDNFYVDYDENGENPIGAQVTEGYAEVGKYKPLFAIAGDQLRSGKFAIKSARTQYDYKVWPEVPKNNKFEKGTQTGSGSNPDGTTYKTFTIDGWMYGTKNTPSLPSLGATTDTAYRTSTYDVFGIEKNREITLEDFTSGEKILQSDPIPVAIGDKFKIDVDIMYIGGGSGTRNVFYAYIIEDGTGVKYFLHHAYSGSVLLKPVWSVGVSNAIQAQSDDFSQWQSVNSEASAIPVNGTMYLAFAANVDSVHPIFRNFTFEYLPFIAGGYLQVKGDYYLRSQSVSLPDIAEDNVKLSDAPRKLLQGAMLFDNGGTSKVLTLLWYRFHSIATPNPTGEEKGFKDLLNLARLNYQWRRMQSIEGTFLGLSYEPQNDPDNKMPVGFHKRYRLTDLPDEGYFVLVAPLKQDLIKGTTNATFLEVSKDGDDGTQLDTAQELKYIFE